ncbi:MAG: diguanylate cyclase [Actinomycetota bacterium]|nr:diguanylate cyclase [Actinomycetota bacterium]
MARQFGDALHMGDGIAAERVVDDALRAGLAPEAVQSLVIAPAMVRIGELWQSRLIGVADEHLATSISQRTLIRLFETISANRDRGRSRERVLLAAVEGQHHSLGLRMVADVLEGAGFDVLYLGEDVPVESLREAVAKHRPAVVGLAFGIASDASCLADSLWVIHEVAPETRVMLGGRAVPPGLRTVGYAWVATTMEVVAAVEDLLAGPVQRLPAFVDLMRSPAGDDHGPREHSVESGGVAAQLARAADEATGLAREHVRRAATYRDLAFRDPLTGLPNRRAFDDELLVLTQDGGVAGALLMIDVDGFKTVNDEQGHQAGDRVLRAIGRAIGDAVRPGDTVARFGGDEFAVLLPRGTPEIAGEIGDRICSNVAAAVEPAVSVSVGVAELAHDPRLGVLAADTALYEAKAAGRDRVVAARPRQVPDSRGPG